MYSASATDAAHVNPNGIKTLLVNGFIEILINGNPVVSLDQEVYQKILLIISS